jgi:hypothetical protein
LLPYRGEAVHARWSGEAMWSPLGRTLWWQTEDPRDKRPLRAPDIAAEMRFTDYGNDVDPVLNAILKARR